MASSKWKSFDEINDIIKTREYYFWGASNWVFKTLKKFSSMPQKIIDNNPNNQGIIYEGFNVDNSKGINLKQKPFIVITTSNYNSVIKDLEELKYVMGDDFCCSPCLIEKKAVDDINNYSKKILFTSPDHSFSHTGGGGIYLLETLSRKIDKLYSGKVRGLVKYKDGYCFVDMLKGLVLTDKSFNQINIIELTKNSEPHGLFVNENLAYVGTPGRDSVSIYNIDDSKKIDEIFITDKWINNKKDNHHLNDVLVIDKSLFISMFSFSGNWLNDVYDGGVVEIDLNNIKERKVIFDKKWMPHSISLHDNKFYVLDSMRGHLYNGANEILFKGNGFLRGLEKIENYFFIAQTPHRYPDKIFSGKSNISVDTGIHIFNIETKLTRFVNIYNTNSIHSILEYED